MTRTQVAILKSLLLAQRAEGRKGRRPVIPEGVIDCYDWRSTRGLLERGYVSTRAGHDYQDWLVTEAGALALEAAR